VQATFTFHGNLTFFNNQSPLLHTAKNPASIKDMVESLGVPHPEIECLVVNGQSIDFDYLMQDGDQVDVYPMKHPLPVDNPIALHPPIPSEIKFILDTHLGRLASFLRMLGFDTLYRNDYPDDELARVSHDEKRILLTRDIGLLKRSLVVYGYFVRHTEPRQRVIEIAQRFDLIHHIQPFKYCMKCNGLLHSVKKEAVADQLQTNTLEYFDEFHQCADCQQIYWRGSHYEKMQDFMQEVESLAQDR